MSPLRMEKVESSMRAAVALVERANRRDWAGFAALLSEDAVLEASAPAPDGARVEGRDAFAGRIRSSLERLEGAVLVVEELAGMAKHCCLRWRLSWRDPDGLPARLRGAALVKVPDALVTEACVYVKAGTGGD